MPFQENTVNLTRICRKSAENLIRICKDSFGIWKASWKQYEPYESINNTPKRLEKSKMRFY